MIKTNIASGGGISWCWYALYTVDGASAPFFVAPLWSAGSLVSVCGGCLYVKTSYVQIYLFVGPYVGKQPP